GRLRLDSLLVNKYLDLPGRMSARLSAGYYEEMFAGAGGQLLYPSRDGRWALDLMVDGLRQREPGDNLALRDYSVLTALVSGHYRLPWYGLTATVRAGQFLARDDGIRYELNRRFRSGVEIGAWYSITNGHDITGPGSPDEPYRDKGVYLAIPLSSMLTMDTRETARLSLSPWMRDVGQMVVPPDDLYRLMEPGIRTADGGPFPLQ
ncbi:MAG: YjbH domain-containing protein, partial [Gammaproteobacteria bacterium]